MSELIETVGMRRIIGTAMLIILALIPILYLIIITFKELVKDGDKFVLIATVYAVLTIIGMLLVEI